MNSAKKNGGIPRSGAIRRRSTPGRNDSAQLGPTRSRQTLTRSTRLELGTAPLPAALNSTATQLLQNAHLQKKKKKKEKEEKENF